MPAISPNDIVLAILDAIEESGSSGALVSAVRSHPRKFFISRSGGESTSLWVYVWTLTHGGRPQLQHEYRIQMTSVSSPLPLNPNGKTVLIGYEPNLQMFAGFDLNRHRSFTQGSPSVQIDIRTIQKAQQDGIAFDRKDNSELAIGIRPDQFLDYVSKSRELHEQGADARTIQPLAAAAASANLTQEAEKKLDEEIAKLAQPRRELVTEVRRLSRLAGFRRKVLFAYGSRCAVTRTQLRLVDAAHILPVGAPGSVDHVRNGLALSPTYHRAYDSGLIFLDENYSMRLNTSKVRDLEGAKLASGLFSFQAPLGKILLPPDQEQWPTIQLIKKANDFRRIPV